MDLILKYNTPAPDTPEGWEKYSMPIGNSYLGGNVFGGIDYERIQITENSTENPGKLGGLNSFADILIHFPHNQEAVQHYERGLDIGKAIAYVNYDCGGVHVERKYFTTYPDKVLVGQITTSEPVDLRFEVQIPYLTEEEGREKRGTVHVEEDTIIMAGTMSAHNVRFEGQLCVFTDGVRKAIDGQLFVEGAKNTWFIFGGATNYELRPEIFMIEEDDKKLRDFDPHDLVCAIMQQAANYSLTDLEARHIADYGELFHRVSLELNETVVPDETTEELLKAYSQGNRSRYLEVLYFQYGRYLLISSSRPGCLPANLQGVWNCHDRSPWGSGYWHNINVQMNYWPAFITNIAETFTAYLDFNLAFRKTAELYASDFVKRTVPEKYTDEPGECGWTIGTGNYAYKITGPGSHSGPGTGGLTSKLFWEYYAFTGDKDILTKVAYPALLSMAKFFLRVVREYDGKQLSVFSASPEQILGNVYGKNTQYYHTVGCAFDQQMIWENANDVLKCVDLIGEENLPSEDLSIIQEIRNQIESYDPVQVGWSGQIKEYREEKFYGEIGEFRHRHISQLVGLYPGTLISTETPAWLDAAKVTLDHRSDRSTGWALAHRLNAWARTGDGNRTYRLYANLIGQRTLPNLWDTHPPFQIDGNFGGTSGVAEMLLQSHEKYIVPLASIPDEWSCGSYTGLAARGGFEIDVAWQGGCATSITIRSKAGNVCRMKYKGIGKARLDFEAKIIDADHIEFSTEAGREYHITYVETWEKKSYPAVLKVTKDLKLCWDFGEPVNIWRAVDSAPEYTLIAQGITGGNYQDDCHNLDKAETVSYKITRADTLSGSESGAYVTWNCSTELERERYRHLLRFLKIDC